MDRLGGVLADALLDLVRAHDVPGLVVGVQQDGERVVRTHGVDDLRTGRPVTERTRFQAGSISKTVTALACAQLATQGELDLDADLRAVWSGSAPATGWCPTLRSLLGHVSGLVGELTPYPERFDEVPDRVLGLPTVPAGAWGYSSTGYALAGLALQRTVGAPFADVARRAVLAPLGMTTAGYDHEPVHRDRATGHVPVGPKERRTAPGVVSEAMAPAGGLVATAADLLALGACVAGDPGLDPRAVTAVTAPAYRAFGVADAAGLGWMLWRTGAGWSLQGHSGTTEGQNAALWVLPEHRATVVVLTNCASGAPLIKAAKARLLSHLGVAETPAEVEVPPQQVEGTFAAGPLTAELRATDEGVVLTVPLVPGVSHNRLRWTSASDFVIADGPLGGSTGHVERDADGAVSWVSVLGRVLVPAGHQGGST